MSLARLVGSRRTMPAVVACCLTLGAGALAGCGGDNGEPAADVTTTTTRQQVVVAGSDGDFNPAGIYHRNAPGVVTILSIFQGGDAGVLGLGGGGAAGQGSGFVISDDGEILTNAHVVTEGGRANGGGRIRPADQVYVEFADRNRIPAKIRGYDPDSDIALLEVDSDGLDLHPLKLGNDEDIVVGEPVAAIGSPFGEDRSLSVGIVSATDRSIESLTQFRIDKAIQTDASINPGNSGGPLLDAEGEVIGINQQIETTSGTDSGVGFAVPVSAVRFSLEQLREEGKVEYAYLGVSTQGLWPQLADELDIDVDHGSLISEVVGGGPADDAGLQGGDEERRFQGATITTGGDVIVAVDGDQLFEDSDLSELISRRRPGETVAVEVLRDNERRTFEVKLEARPERVRG